jgi:hypothetical protein
VDPPPHAVSARDAMTSILANTNSFFIFLLQEKVGWITQFSKEGGINMDRNTSNPFVNRRDVWHIPRT